MIPYFATSSGTASSCHLPLKGEGTPYRLAALGTSPNGGSMREEQAPPLRGGQREQAVSGRGVPAEAEA